MEEHGLSDRKCGGQSETDPAVERDESRPGLGADRGQQEYALADRKGNGEPVAWRAREDYERPAD